MRNGSQADAHGILQLDARVRIEREQPVTQGCDIEALELGAQFRVGRYACQAESVAQRVDVEHRAAFHDRLLSASLDVCNRLARALDVLRRVEIGRRVDEVDHVIPDLLSLLRAGLVGRDIEPLIDLTRICHDDLAT
jgi:hypothetical protein